MADQVQWRRGTTAETAAFIGAQGEITVDTDKDVTVVHDGVTPGGFPAAKETAITNTTIYFDDDVGGGSVADAYVLIPKSNSRTPTNYFDGIALGFVTANPNTGPSTVNFSGLGVKNIKLADGSDPLPGQIDGRVDLVFDLGNDWFELSVAELSSEDKKKLDFYKGNNRALWPTIKNSAIDTSNDIDFDAGAILDSTGLVLIDLTSTITKQLDAGFVPGTNQGGLFSGAVAADTTYHCFLIVNDSDGSIDAGFDTDPDAANIPGGYTAYRRIHDIETGSGGAIKGFLQIGDRMTLLSRETPFSSGTLSLTGILIQVTPSGSKKIAIFTSALADTISSNSQVMFTCPDCNNDAVGTATAGSDLILGSAENNQIAQFQVPTNTSGEIRMRSNVATVNQSLSIRAIGWIDERIS